MPFLSSIRVLDTADSSGAFCGRILADLGMQVVRAAPHRCERRLADPWFRAFYDAGKSIEDTPATVAADVVVTTGRRSDLVRSGLDFETLASSRPGLIVANISPFGLSGPRAEWRSSCLVASAAGGMLWPNGWPDEAPLQPLGLQAYHCAGIHAAIGILLAVRARERTGTGQLIDISLQESVVASVEHVTGAFRQDGTVHRRAGTLHWTGGFRTVPTSDGEMVATHLGDWDALRAWLGADGVDLEDEGWDDPERRRAGSAEIFERIAGWSSRYPTESLVEQAQLRRLAFAALGDLRDCAEDQQLHARRFFTTRDSASGPLRVAGPMFGFAAVGGSPPSAVPGRARVSVAGRSATAGSVAAGLGAVPPLAGGALSGVRVLDLTWVVAGPVATRVLADHGAQVIKLEHPNTGTATPRRGGLFGNLNRGKQSVAVDLTRAGGLEVLRQLVAASDVLVENFSARVLSNWGLDDEELVRLNPGLVTVHMSGFGRTGPRRDWVSYGPVLQALAGFTSHMRHPGGRPAGWGYSYSDMVSGYAAALAVMAALHEGGGRIIDLAQLEVLVATVGPALTAVLNGGPVPDAIGNASQEGRVAPHGVYRCLDEPRRVPDRRCAPDRWCAIVVDDEDGWRAFAEVVAESWVREPRFASAALRFENRVELDSRIGGWTRRRTAASIQTSMQDAGVACAVVADARDLLDGDPHLAARGAWSRIATDGEDDVEVDATPIRLSATPGTVSSAGPRLGEHTDDVLRGVLRWSADQVRRLRREGGVL